MNAVLDDSLVHYAWDNSIAPRIEVEPGSTVRFTTRDAADHYYTPDSTHADVARKGPLQGHPLTGPVRVRGAAPGDTLAVTVLEVKSSLGFGWTAIRPGRGLLPEAEFPRHFLQIWDLGTDGLARMRGRRDIAVPMAPFPGILGTALPEPGSFNTIQPRKNGRSMDQKHLARGTTLYLPVWVDGALFSVGDAHAAQGDGEVCVTAVEMSAEITLRIELVPGRNIPEPQLRTTGPLCPEMGARGYFATTACGPDLFENSCQAIRYLIDHLVTERGLSREEAYVLCSVCADLKVSEIVDSPNWLVSAFLPEMVFV